MSPLYPRLVTRSARTLRPMDFSEALHLIKAGKRASRTGWNGTGMWVFFVPGSRFTVGADRPIGQAAPDMVGNTVDYRPHLDMHTADGQFVPWAPTQSDVLADDWEVTNHA